MVAGAGAFARTGFDVFDCESNPMHGGVRHRGTIHVVSPIRSCRTANLLLNLYTMTGDAVYRRAAIANGDYLLRHAVDAQARQAAACRELAALWKHTGKSGSRRGRGPLSIAWQATRKRTGAGTRSTTGMAA